MHLPEQVFRLVVTDRGNLRWSELGSKTYNSRAEALKRLDYLRSRSVVCYLYASAPLVWHPYPDMEDNE